MKNSNDTIGIRTRDLPACSAVPQPTAPPRTPRLLVVECNLSVRLKKPLFLVVTLHELYSLFCCEELILDVCLSTLAGYCIRSKLAQVETCQCAAVGRVVAVVAIEKSRNNYCRYKKNEPVPDRLITCTFVICGPSTLGKLGRFLKQPFIILLLGGGGGAIYNGSKIRHTCWQTLLTILAAVVIPFVQVYGDWPHVSLRTCGQSPYTCKTVHIIHNCDSIDNHCCYQYRVY